MRRTVLPLLAAPMLLAAPATAQTSLDYHAQFSPATTVLYLPFTVTTMGSFTFQTSGLQNIDPSIWLFEGAWSSGPVTGAALGFNDDGWMAQPGFNQCLGAGNTCHSTLAMFLGTGDYTLAMSVYDFTEAEARAGSASFGETGQQLHYCNDDANWSDCNYEVNVSSFDGVATNAVPEPATMLLLGSGLAGIGAVKRRRRKQAE